MNDATITFEGITRGSELLGATQASFSVDRPGRHAKETSVLLNDPAAAYLASEAGLPNDDAFKAHAAMVAGEAWLAEQADGGGHIDSVYFLTKATVEARPAIIDRLRTLSPV